MFFKHLTWVLGSADVVWSLVKRWLAVSVHFPDWPGIVVPQETEDELKLRVAVMQPLERRLLFKHWYQGDPNQG